MRYIGLTIFFVTVLLSNNVMGEGVISHWEIKPTSLVTHDVPSLQQVNISFISEANMDSCQLKVYCTNQMVEQKTIYSIRQGTNSISTLLKEPVDTLEAKWVLSQGTKLLAEKQQAWIPPRHWTLYVIKSAHVDIGLHNAQYKQRYMTGNYINNARQLMDHTSDWAENSKYRYFVEGLWWWLNYPQDHSERLADDIVENYIKPGLMGIGASHSGNHTQVYSTEELCRSTYYQQQIKDRWGLSSEAMLMVDNNGITWPLVQAYSEVGIKYLGFLPNSWNPPTVGGTRIDVGWDSELPHLFYWKGADEKSKMLIWTHPHYIDAGRFFGIQTCVERKPFLINTDTMETAMAEQLLVLESRYPYNIWLMPNYDDDELPSLIFSNLARSWNKKWKWPEVRTIGDISEPFRKVEENFGNQIPILKGMITGGWSQHPPATASLLAAKRETHRLLPVAEKLSTIARLLDNNYIYPQNAYRQAWDALICNDEHSYGVSDYKGRPVYDTWMQHHDWLEKADDVSGVESKKALKIIAEKVTTDGASILVFNSTLMPKKELVEVELPEEYRDLNSISYPNKRKTPVVREGHKIQFQTDEIPAMGYTVFKLSEGEPLLKHSREVSQAPVIENTFYRIQFSDNGAIRSIFDKKLKREIIDQSAQYKCNQFVYSRDGNQTFTSPEDARFRRESSALGQTVIVRLDDVFSGAAIEQRIFLPKNERLIYVENRLDHITDIAYNKRWYSFGYYAFPFNVPQASFKIGMNGCTADPYKDQTGLGTNSYHVADTWSYAGNKQMGVALIQFDSQLVEFGNIHSTKNTFEKNIPEKSHIYAYVFNNWLYGHAFQSGPSHINACYRYVIYSHSGNFERENIAQLAEKITTPSQTAFIPQKQEGKLSESHSFLSVDASNLSLLTLKMSEKQGEGIVARFHETKGENRGHIGIQFGFGKRLKLSACTITEEPYEELNKPVFGLSPYGFQSLKIEIMDNKPDTPQLYVADNTDKSLKLKWDASKEDLQYNIYRGDHSDFHPDQYHLLATVKDSVYIDDWLNANSTYYYRIAAVNNNLTQSEMSGLVHGRTSVDPVSPPAKVGSFFTGLISTPKAWRGDTPDILYMQWGQNRENDLSHYEVYRGNSPDFELSDASLLAKVKPGPYVTVPFKDSGLKAHTSYYYRVLAVDHRGNKGEPSEVFQGITGEIDVNKLSK